MVTLQKTSNHAGGSTEEACGRDNSKTSSESAAVGGKEVALEHFVVSRGSKRSKKTSGQCNPSRVLNSQDYVLYIS